MSAISMMPALSACTSSPVPGTSTTIETSAVRMMSTSSCPTPTVSMMMTSLPAASRTSAASPVARASPPRWPRVAMLRMKTSASAACACIRRRSPSTAPPLNGLVGSTAMMPTVDAAVAGGAGGAGTPQLGRQPIDQRALARAGRPGHADQVRAARAAGRSRATSAALSGRSSSMSEMARAIARGSPASTRSARRSVTSGPGAGGR